MKNDLKTATSNTEMVTISRAEYDALLQKIEGYAELNQKLEWLMEQLRLVKKKTYGSSSEHTREELMDQLSFVFNEAEAWQAAEEPVLLPGQLLRLHAVSWPLEVSCFQPLCHQHKSVSLPI